MSTHNLLTPYLTNQPKRARGAKHVSMHLRRLLDYHLLSHWETLFLHLKDPLYQILICRLSQQRKRAWTLLYHIIYFILKFTCYRLALNAVFANWFRLWYLSCLNLCDGFVNFNGRVILSPLFMKREYIILRIDSISVFAPWNMVLIFLLVVCHKLMFSFKQSIILHYFEIPKYHWSILT